MAKKEEPTLGEFVRITSEKEKTLLLRLALFNLLFLGFSFIIMLIAEGIFKLGVVSWFHYSILVVGNLFLIFAIIFSLLKNYKVWLLKYIIAVFTPLLIMGWMYFTDPQYNRPIFGFFPILVFIVGVFFYEIRTSFLTTLIVAISYGLLLFYYSKIGFLPSFYEISLNYLILLMSFGGGYFVIPRIRFFLIELMEKRREVEEAKTVLEIKVRARTRELEELAKSLDEKVKERTKELKEKIETLEKFQRLTVGRELKMIELKNKIKELTEKIKKLESN